MRVNQCTELQTSNSPNHIIKHVLYQEYMRRSLNKSAVHYETEDKFRGTVGVRRNKSLQSLVRHGCLLTSQYIICHKKALIFSACFLMLHLIYPPKILNHIFSARALCTHLQNKENIASNILQPISTVTLMPFYASSFLPSR